MLFLISYDPQIAIAEEYDRIDVLLQSMFAVRVQKSAWILNDVNNTSESLFQWISQHLKDGDSLIVTQAISRIFWNGTIAPIDRI